MLTLRVTKMKRKNESELGGVIGRKSRVDSKIAKAVTLVIPEM